MSTNVEIYGENSHPLNALSPLAIPTYDGSGEAVHPSVLYFPSRWQGYLYWMAFTPYKNSDERFEKPSIAVSDNGIDWIEPDGLKNPLVDKPKDGHLSDPNLCFFNNQLYLCYRKRYRLGQGLDYDEISLIHSGDGIHWSQPKSILAGNNEGASQLLSPQIVLHSNRYFLYTVNNKIRYIQRRVADDPQGPWSSPENILLIHNLPNNMIPWHINVTKHQDDFEFIIVMLDKKKVEPNTLYYARNHKGKIILLDDNPLLRPSKQGWDNKTLYQSSLVPILQSKQFVGYSLYYSAYGTNTGWKIGITTLSPERLYNPKKTVAEKIAQQVTSSGSNTGSFQYYCEQKLPKKAVIVLANQILKNQWKVAKGFEFIPIDIKNFSWNQYPIQDNTWKFRLHSLSVIDQLVQAYEYTSDTRYLEQGQEIILSWHKYHPISEWKTKRWAYYDHATALRAIYLIEFWYSYRSLTKEINKDFVSKLLLILYEHAELLTNDEFYEEKDNHGIYQDIALMSIALALPEFDESKKWFNLGYHRFEKQILDTVSAEGVHLEHSPEYQITVYNLLFRAIQWLKQNNIPINPQIEARIRKMPLFIAYILKPDQTLPLFGNTYSIKITPDRIPNIDDYASLKYLLSNSREGTKPANLIQDFAPSGYGVLRNLWNTRKPSFADSVYFAITAGFNSKVHKHPDDLSFELFAFGRDIIVDTGKYSYSPGPEREYVLKTQAHNVVLVDNQEYNLNEKNIGKSGILHYERTNENYEVIKAYHQLYAGVRHERQVFYDHEQTFILVDDLYSKNPHLYSQLFHLGAGLKIKETGATTIVEDSNSSFRLTTMQLNRPNEIEYLNPQISFTSKKNYSKEQNFVLCYNAKGYDLRFITLLHLSKDKADRFDFMKAQRLLFSIHKKYPNFFEFES
ncbi:MAG: heparinase II/III family protein [Chitinophagales bacterium]